MRVVIAGASGLIGSALVPLLRENGHEVVRLVRRSPQAPDERGWDPPAGHVQPGPVHPPNAGSGLGGVPADPIGGWIAQSGAVLQANGVPPEKIDPEALRTIIQQLLQAQNPVLSWWALASVASRASATITVTAIFLVGTWLHLNGLATVGEIVTFMSMATMLVGRLEQAVSFINQLFMQAPKLREFFEILDTAPAVHDLSLIHI